MCDDGDRTDLTNKAYGACLVTVLRGLKKEGRLDATHFPSLETIMKNAASWGSAMKDMACISDYDLVCKAIGRRLFKDKSEAVIALEKARLNKWMESLSKEEQAEMKDEDEDEEDEDETKPWYTGGRDSDEDAKNPDFTLSRIWKEYKVFQLCLPLSLADMCGKGTLGNCTVGANARTRQLGYHQVE